MTKSALHGEIMTRCHVDGILVHFIDGLFHGTFTSQVGTRHNQHTRIGIPKDLHLIVMHSVP